MLKPITEQEKLLFTLQVEAERGTQELLSELYYDKKFEGYVDIWPILSTRKQGQVKLEIKSKEVMSSVASPTHRDATRFHVNQAKGVKKLG